ncbi:sensor histidine kinase KdpD [Streptomonospora sediminis]
MARGELRVYLGAAPGVGKTFAMLAEAHRRRSRGADVVAACVETHGRRRTAAMVGDLETVPPQTAVHRGAAFAEMDLDAVLARRPQVALVDELAHTNVPGSANAKRWQDVKTLLDAGITVLSTVNIQHLESLNDVVKQITGVVQRETVPDAWVRQAEQIELIDMAPEALRRRMAHGNVYAAAAADTALQNYFRVGNLTALRELALLWLADKVDDQFDRYRGEHGVTATWEARERVAVALTGGAEGETLIRRAARIAARSKGADLLAVHVARSDGLAGADPALLARQRVLVESLGGTYHQVLGDDVPTALIEFARGANATQLVLGASRRSRLGHALSPGVGITTTAMSGSIDVHTVTHEEAARGRRRSTAAAAALPRHRRLAGFALALGALPLLVLGSGLPHTESSLPTVILLVLASVTAAALAGGMGPAVLAALGGFLMLDFFFTRPYHTLVIDHPHNVLALVVFSVVAVAVSAVVDRAARRTREAARAHAQAQTLAAVAGSVLRGSRPLAALLERLRETFGSTAVALLERSPGAPPDPAGQWAPEAWSVAASAGEPPRLEPGAGDVEVAIDGALRLVLQGTRLAAEDRRVVEAFAAQAAVALRQQRLAEEAAAARPLAEADKLRTALLAAVSHDLRGPLASAKAVVSSLRSQEVRLDEHDQAELLATADEALDQLSRLVANLLDMSRLRAGVLGVTLTDFDVADALVPALEELGPAAGAVRVGLRDGLGAVRADRGLLQRVLANVVGNAVRFNPAGAPVEITAAQTSERIDLRVIDHGPGVAEAELESIFASFQRLSDTDNSTGVGLGLALSRGLAEAMGGGVAAEPTPGGGLTIVVSLVAAGGSGGQPP